MATVADQRKTALAARRRLTAVQRQRASIAACRYLGRLPEMRRARHIGLYWPLPSEIDPSVVQHMLGRRDRRFYYPRVSHDQLRFVPVARNGRWTRSNLGVQEPAGWSHPVNALDVLIMPLAGFDAGAHRIGLGGGFYDRTLAPVRDRGYRSPTRIGLAFECQRLPAIETRPWDIELASVVTERGVYRASRST
ncbi:5-formyltetrahydrofolate cyclo-ligase [Salinisphaera sp. SPP-AMP-43]|uniref:5-formyltetrahydrofolate cyclo-ligase n=1 Tax=Salinisphaera sp. SPP-AMP-43 TaxID=3121288 RepID=UPI003C6E13CE